MSALHETVMRLIQEGFSKEYIFERLREADDKRMSDRRASDLADDWIREYIEKNR